MATLDQRARAASAMLDLFGFNKGQKRGPDGKWIKMGGAVSAPPSVTAPKASGAQGEVYAPNSPPGAAWGPFKKSTVYDMQYDYGHLAHEDNSEYAADKKYTERSFKVGDLHPTQDDDFEEWGDGEGDAKPFVITKDGRHYLIDGHHRAVRAGAGGSLNVWHLNLDEPDEPASPSTPEPPAAADGPSVVRTGDGDLAYGGVRLETSAGPSPRGYAVTDAGGNEMGRLREPTEEGGPWTYGSRSYTADSAEDAFRQLAADLIDTYPHLAGRRAAGR